MSSSQWLFDARRFDVVAELVSMLRNQRLSCPRVDRDLLEPTIVADDVMMFDRLCAGTFLDLGCVLGHGCYWNVSRVGSQPGGATFSPRWPASGVCSYLNRIAGPPKNYGAGDTIGKQANVDPRARPNDN
jgi:hypothetical protein